MIGEYLGTNNKLVLRIAAYQSPHRNCETSGRRAEHRRQWSAFEWRLELPIRTSFQATRDRFYFFSSLRANFYALRYVETFASRRILRILPSLSLDFGPLGRLAFLSDVASHEKRIARRRQSLPSTTAMAPECFLELCRGSRVSRV